MVKAQVCRECKKARFQERVSTWSQMQEVDFSKLKHPVQTEEITCPECMKSKLQKA